jgi:hypothetical protein
MPTAFSIGTIVKVAKDPGRGMRVIQTTVGLSDDYPTGGEDLETALAAIAKGPGYTILAAWAEPVAGYYFGYDLANGKIIAYVASTGAEAALHTDLKAFTAVVVTILAL